MSEFRIEIIGTIIFYVITIGLAIEFLLTPEKVEITIPLKVFFALLFLVFIGMTNFWRKK